jgi:hypothetical protein
MRPWWRRSIGAAGHVADRPGLWLPGALTWTVTVGWVAFVIGVARPPSVAELTFLGARSFTSGAWPWNAVLISAAALAVALVCFLGAAAGEAALLRGRLATGRDVARLFVLGLVCAVPAVVGLFVLLATAAVIAPEEFNAPEAAPGPLVRAAVRLSPILVAIAVAMAAGAAIHAAAARHAVAGAGLDMALRRAPRTLARAGIGALGQAVLVAVLRIGYLAIGATLLRVLWAPIGERLDVSGLDAAVGLLLVGFVAIWLCLVLGGGALHAWGSVSWTGVLGLRLDDRQRSAEPMETSTGT